MSFILRGAMGFLLGGVFWTLIWKRWEVPGGIWTSVTLASATFGAVAAAVLQGLMPRERKLKLWAGAGWALGGLMFCILFRELVLSRGTSATAMHMLIPAVAAGVIGGLGFGIGWSGVSAGLLLGLASGILLPGSLWFNTWVMAHAGAWLLNVVPMPTMAAKIVVWILALGGFAVYGACIGLLLGLFDESEGGTIVSAAPLEARRSAAPRPSAFPVARSNASVAAVPAVRRASDDPPPEPAPPPKPKMPAEDEITFQSDSVAITPYEETNPETEYARGGLPPAPPDLSAKGTFQTSRRNYHPDFQPGADGKTSGELRIMRNYHPIFGDVDPNADDNPSLPDALSPLGTSSETYEVELEGDQRHDEVDITQEDDDYGFLNEDDES